MRWKETLATVSVALAPASSVAAPPRYFAYQGQADGSIKAFMVKANGDLSPLGFRVPGKQYITLLRHPTQPVLYAVSSKIAPLARTDESSPGVYRLTVYAVMPNGRLSPRQTLSVPDLPAAFTPDGKWLYIPLDDRAQQKYRVASNGTLRLTGQTEGGGKNYNWGSSDGYYTLRFVPNGHFAYRYHHWSHLDTAGASMQRFRVTPNGELVKDGAKWDTYLPGKARWETDTGDFIISGDGQTVLMNGDSGDVSVLRLNASGEPHDGQAIAPGRAPGPVWAAGRAKMLDGQGRFVLMTAWSQGPGSLAPSFRIGQVTGPGQLRQTARFGDFIAPGKSAPERDNVQFRASLRPDNFINLAASCNYPTKYFCTAVYRLRPDGSVQTVRSWTKVSDKGKSLDEEPIFRTVFIERPGSPVVKIRPEQRKPL